MMVSLNEWWIWRVCNSQSMNDISIKSYSGKAKFCMSVTVCMTFIMCRKIHFYLYACITLTHKHKHRRHTLIRTNLVCVLYNVVWKEMHNQKYSRICKCDGIYKRKIEIEIEPMKIIFIQSRNTTEKKKERESEKIWSTITRACGCAYFSSFTFATIYRASNLNSDRASDQNI